ncbi:MAG: hypothetical protein JOY71_03605 [Acetobacteraceae bacterium]|nr:hypothetical protein [Acetobacteraceae bacterium]
MLALVCVGRYAARNERQFLTGFICKTLGAKYVYGVPIPNETESLHGQPVTGIKRRPFDLRLIPDIRFIIMGAIVIISGLRKTNSTLVIVCALLEAVPLAQAVAFVRWWRERKEARDAGLS